MQITLFGIPNCNQIKIARDWLAAQGIDYRFHDYKKAGIDAATIEHWFAQIDWRTLINRKGTTWRALPDAQKYAIHDAAAALALMLERPSVIKRPVLQCRDASGKDRFLVGFDAQCYASFFQRSAS